MFGLFGGKKYKPSLKQDYKDWVEKNFFWFIEIFGLEHLKKSPFILPTLENFPYDDVRQDEQFVKLFEQLCQHWELDSSEINIKIFDDILSKQWANHTESKERIAAGLYNQSPLENGKRFNVMIAKSNLDHPQTLVAVMAHELAHVKLLGGRYIDRDSPDMEPLTDLATIFFGFGIFVANSCEIKDLKWMYRVGYLPNEVISYSNALICYITNHDHSIYIKEFNSGIKELFKQDSEFLKKTNDTTLESHQVEKSVEAFEIKKGIENAYDVLNFDEVIEQCDKILEKDFQNFFALNNKAYALLLKKDYHKAIDVFTKAIGVEHFGAHLYRNRGYCKLQLGDLENAYEDLHSSLEMTPDDPYSSRNMGAYYLKINQHEIALQHFEEAVKIDPKTELINFYLGQAYKGLGNSEKANFYFEKSRELKEYNDSVIE